VAGGRDRDGQETGKERDGEGREGDTCRNMQRQSASQQGKMQNDDA